MSAKEAKEFKGFDVHAFRAQEEMEEESANKR
jgi:hypothetical protein